MYDPTEIRRANGRKVVAKFGATAISQLLGYASPSMMSQTFGKKPRRAPTEKLMRRIEDVLKFPIGALDIDGVDIESLVNGTWRTPPLQSLPPALAHGIAVRAPGAVSPQTPAAAAPRNDTALVEMTIRMLGDMMEKNGVAITPRQFATVFALVYPDIVAHGGEVREQQLQKYVELFK